MTISNDEIEWICVCTKITSVEDAILCSQECIDYQSNLF